MGKTQVAQFHRKVQGIWRRPYEGKTRLYKLKDPRCSIYVRAVAMRGVVLVGDADMPKRFNQLAREQMKHKLLADILVDMEICRLEGWGVTDYLKELIQLLEGLLPKSS